MINIQITSTAGQYDSYNWYSALSANSSTLPNLVTFRPASPAQTSSRHPFWVRLAVPSCPARNRPDSAIFRFYFHFPLLYFPWAFSLFLHYIFPFLLLTFPFDYCSFLFFHFCSSPLPHFLSFNFLLFLLFLFFLSFHCSLPSYHTCSTHSSLPLHLSFPARLFLTRLNFFLWLISHRLIDVMAHKDEDLIYNTTEHFITVALQFIF